MLLWHNILLGVAQGCLIGGVMQCVIREIQTTNVTQWWTIMQWSGLPSASMRPLATYCCCSVGHRHLPACMSLPLAVSCSPPPIPSLPSHSISLSLTHTVYVGLAMTTTEGTTQGRWGTPCQLWTWAQACHCLAFSCALVCTHCMHGRGCVRNVRVPE